MRYGASLIADPAPGDEALWRALKIEGSAVAREKLFALYLPFARGVAARYFREKQRGDLEYADLHQLACAGLLQAIDRFDPDLQIPFKGYAARRIGGSVLDGIARMSEVREQISYRHRARRERARSLAQEGAENLPRDQAMDALIDMAVGLALGFMLDGTGLYRGEGEADIRAGAYESLVWKKAVQRVMGELEQLPDRERSIIRHHYLGGVGFEQIAALLGLSKGRVSQLHKGAILLLRKRLDQAGDFKLER